MPYHPGPNKVFIPLLVSCPTCKGSGSYNTEDDGICHCTSCKDGLKPAAVELALVLSLIRPDTPTADIWGLIVEAAAAQPTIIHPLLHNLPEFPRRRLLTFDREDFAPTMSGFEADEVDNVGESPE